jgi:hypothetical protein
VFAFAITVLALLAPTVPQGNLLRNPGAEEGQASQSGETTVEIPGWQTTSTFTVVALRRRRSARLLHVPADERESAHPWRQELLRRRLPSRDEQGDASGRRFACGDARRRGAGHGHVECLAQRLSQPARPGYGRSRLHGGARERARLGGDRPGHARRARSRLQVRPEVRRGTGPARDSHGARDDDGRAARGNLCRRILRQPQLFVERASTHAHAAMPSKASYRHRWVPSGLEGLSVSFRLGSRSHTDKKAPFTATFAASRKLTTLLASGVVSVAGQRTVIPGRLTVHCP